MGLRFALTMLFALGMLPGTLAQARDHQDPTPRVVHDGDVTMLRQLATEPMVSTPDRTARVFLAEHAQQLDLDLARISVRHSRSSSWRGRTLQRFEQHHHGLPVVGAVMVLKLDRSARLTMAMSTLRDDLTVDPTPTIDAATAREAAVQAVQSRTTTVGQASPPQLSVLPSPAGGQLVYRVAVFSATPIARWMVLVDAHSGVVYRMVDQRIHAQGQAYEENPDVSGLITDAGVNGPHNTQSSN